MDSETRKNLLVMRGMVRLYQEHTEYFEALFRDLRDVKPTTISENLDRGMIEALKRLHRES